LVLGLATSWAVPAAAWAYQPAVDDSGPPTFNPVIDSLDLAADPTDDASDLEADITDDASDLESDTADDASDLEADTPYGASDLEADTTDDASDIEAGTPDDASDLEVDTPDDASDLEAHTATDAPTMTGINAPPNFTPGPNITVFEDGGPQIRTGWATDITPGAADESDQKVTLIVTADDPSLFSEQPLSRQTAPSPSNRRRTRTARRL